MTHQNYSPILAILPFVYLPLQLQKSVPGKHLCRNRVFHCLPAPCCGLTAVFLFSSLLDWRSSLIADFLKWEHTTALAHLITLGQFQLLLWEDETIYWLTNKNSQWVRTWKKKQKYQTVFLCPHPAVQGVSRAGFHLKVVPSIVNSHLCSQVSKMQQSGMTNWVLSCRERGDWPEWIRGPENQRYI